MQDTKKKNIYVVEDMAISRAALIDTLEDHNFEVVGSSASADKAWLEIKTLAVDIALLDINLAGDLDGIWLAEMIRKHTHLAIVFLTAHGDKKTLEKLNRLSPNGYVMKPYNTPTLITTLEIALKTHANLKDKKLDVLGKEAFVVIREKGINVKIVISEICYIHSNGNYLTIHTNNKQHTFRDTLPNFIKNLSSHQVLQVHRRYAINLKKVSEYTATSVTVCTATIAVSKTYKKQFIELIEA